MLAYANGCPLQTKRISFNLVTARSYIILFTVFITDLDPIQRQKLYQTVTNRINVFSRTYHSILYQLFFK